ncbi:hypothetical protein ACJX0J_024037 [Zea mays]
MSIWDMEVTSIRESTVMHNLTLDKTCKLHDNDTSTSNILWTFSLPALLNLYKIQLDEEEKSNKGKKWRVTRVDPSYDDLPNVVEKLGTLLEKRNRKIKKLDVFVESLHV